MTQAFIHAHEPRIIVSTRQMEQENEKNGVSVQILTKFRGRISKKQVLRPLAEKPGLDTLGEDREFHQGRVVSFAAVVW